ncbi:MAG: tRNA (adenosine(37)-N6)-threonylcarbamoyltransferase complex ATPase subunit type 1 TsaE [Phycisphaerae bacterium]|nr:tRNA (adenosine(37)-N6)-threonylcarbamoyltransferase complex ATPase subunit type 1 TsaE [Phycisphaerae bacterium]
MTDRLTVQTHSPEQTRELACRLARRVQLPAVIGLVGQLGAGKTEFVKGLGRGLSVDERSICSATFVIICEYGDGVTLVHVDAYRLTSGQELDPLGWDEILERKDCLVAVEWADRVADRMPAETLWVRQEVIAETDRRITLEAPRSGPWQAVLADPQIITALAGS